MFRWRTAMNDYYTSNWNKLRHIEGASQRIQEDTMRFARTLEGLGVSFIEALMTLIAFLPVLFSLSSHVKAIPIVGAIPYALVWAAISWALLGTLILVLVGYKLPGLEFPTDIHPFITSEFPALKSFTWIISVWTKRFNMNVRPTITCLEARGGAATSRACGGARRSSRAPRPTAAGSHRGSHRRASRCRAPGPGRRCGRWGR